MQNKFVRFMCLFMAALMVAGLLFTVIFGVMF